MSSLDRKTFFVEENVVVFFLPPFTLLDVIGRDTFISFVLPFLDQNYTVVQRPFH